MKRERKTRQQRDRREQKRRQRRQGRKRGLQLRLMHVLGFTEHDLNNLDHWKPVAPPRPLRLSYRLKCMDVAMLIVLFVVLILVPLGLPFEWFLLLLVIFILQIVLTNLPNIFLYLRSKSAGHEIETVEGILTKSPAEIVVTEAISLLKTRTNTGKPDVFQLTVGDMTFDVSDAVHNAFEDGLPYRVYFMRGSNVVVAAEVLLPGI